MSVDGFLNSGSGPVLEAMVRFSGARQRLIAHNVANWETPGFRPVDVDPQAFQAQLGRAIDDRRDREARGLGGGLVLDQSGPARLAPGGERMVLKTAPIGDNLMHHDGNDRQMERLMQDLSENLLAFRTASELLRGRFRSIQQAIRERF